MKNKKTMAKRIKVITETNGIPVCPHCDKPTRRTEDGPSMTTCVYYPPIYDENGVNTNPDRNTTTRGYKCLECNESYTTSGNYVDGFHYV